MTKSTAMTAAQGMILERLIEAMETDIALPVRVGPKQFGSSMPDYIHTPSEIFAREREDWAETAGQRTAYERKAVQAQLERRRRCSADRISRMEEAFGWVRHFIFDEEARQVLLAYAEVKAREWDWSRYLNSRNKRNPRKKAWAKRTVYRWIIRSIQLIEAGISQRGPLWPAQADLHVAHGRAKQPGKSISSDLHAWTAPDENPALRRL
jgi:hypothetical protein